MFSLSFPKMAGNRNDKILRVVHIVFSLACLISSAAAEAGYRIRILYESASSQHVKEPFAILGIYVSCFALGVTACHLLHIYSYERGKRLARIACILDSLLAFQLIVVCIYNFYAGYRLFIPQSALICVDVRCSGLTSVKPNFVTATRAFAVLSFFLFCLCLGTMITCLIKAKFASQSNGGSGNPFTNRGYGQEADMLNNHSRQMSQVTRNSEETWATRGVR